MGGGCEVKAPESLLWKGDGGDALPFGRGGTGGRAVPLPALGVELEAPRDHPLAQREPEE